MSVVARPFKIKIISLNGVNVRQVRLPWSKSQELLVEVFDSKSKVSQCQPKIFCFSLSHFHDVVIGA